MQGQIALSQGSTYRGEGEGEGKGITLAFSTREISLFSSGSVKSIVRLSGAPGRLSFTDPVDCTEDCDDPRCSSDAELGDAGELQGSNELVVGECLMVMDCMPGELADLVTCNFPLGWRNSGLDLT